MAVQNAYQKYQEQSVSTLTQGELLILLYDEAVKSIRMSMLLIRKKKLCDAHNCIIKAQNIVLYLIDSLDFRYQISNELLKLYDFIYSTLVRANMKKDCNALQDVLDIITGLRDTWSAAERESRGKV